MRINEIIYLTNVLYDRFILMLMLKMFTYNLHHIFHCQLPPLLPSTVKATPHVIVLPWRRLCDDQLYLFTCPAILVDPRP